MQGNAREEDEKAVLSKDPEYQKLLMQASGMHQQFIEMTAEKGRFDTNHAAQLVERAESLYHELLNRDPKASIVLYQLATLYMQTNRNGMAINLLDPLIQRLPPRIEWLNNIGAAYRNEHMNAEARAAFEQALKLEYHPDVLANLCALWVNEGYPEKGIPYGRQCLALKPDHKQGQWNLGLLLLENKEYEEGFKHYAHGFFTGERIVRSYMNPEGREAPFWLGEDLKGKTIVLHGEQGIGDELLFLQFVPEFQKAHPDTRIVLDVHPRLCTAIQRSFPDIQDIFPTRKTTPEWNTVLRVDYKDGIGSLPKWYYASRRKNAGWLKNDAVLAEKYRLWVNGIQEKFNQKDKPVIGIAWTGGRKKTRTDLRSIPLDQWLPVLKQDATFVSLDYNPGAEMQAGEFYKKHGIPVHHWPDVTENTDYEHSLALAGVCDLVICVNTSIVHARGSMDLPCWTLTPHGHAWRYGKKDTINPFYNSVKQYHQEDGQDWDVALNKVAKDLRRYIKFVKGSDNAAA